MGGAVCLSLYIKLPMKMKTARQIAIQTYLPLGFILIALQLFGFYILNERLLASAWGLLIWLVVIIIAMVGIQQFKKGNSGFATFRETFTIYFFTILGFLLGSFLIMELLYLIDDGLVGRLNEYTFETQVSMMKKFSGKDLEPKDIAQLKKVLSENMDKARDPKYLALGLASYLVMFSVIGLIVAAITKKNRPEFL